MNILLVSRGCPTANDPKWGCFEKDQAEALKSLGHTVMVICIDCRFSFKPYLPKIKRASVNGIEYISYRGLPQAIISLIAGNQTAIKMEQQMIDKLYSMIKNKGFKPDVVYSHFILNSSAATILKKKYGIPFVAIEHSSELVKDKLASIIRSQAKEAYENADQLITVSDYLKRKIKENFKKDNIVVPNMLGKEFLTQHPKDLKDTKGERIVFLSVGALIPRKGYLELLEAFSKAKIGSDWELRIIGYGSLHHKIKKKIDKLRLENNVKLLGAKTKEEILKEMASSDVFVLNSKSETFGVVYIEAMSQGLPCIATNCGGTEGIVSISDGINVEVGNQKELIDALEYMYQHHDDYDRSLIRKQCLSRYSPETVSKQIELILYNTIDKCKS